MKINWFYIRMFVLLGLTVFLFAFSKQRNATRKIEKVQVNFIAGENLFITKDAVDKLLIQNNKGLVGQDKEILVLKELEHRLDSHAMISDADVYLTLDGVLEATIRQRKPLARVQARQAFYIDEHGDEMPLSENYSARVPLIEGLPKDKLKEVYPLLVHLGQDEFLQKQIVGIARDREGVYRLKPRVLEYEIVFGTISDVDVKFRNYKAFYQKAVKDSSLNTYKQVDLRFQGQVVGTKK